MLLIGCSAPQKAVRTLSRLCGTLSLFELQVITITVVKKTCATCSIQSGKLTSITGTRYCHRVDHDPFISLHTGLNSALSPSPSCHHTSHFPPRAFLPARLFRLRRLRVLLVSCTGCSLYVLVMTCVFVRELKVVESRCSSWTKGRFQIFFERSSPTNHRISSLLGFA